MEARGLVGDSGDKGRDFGIGAQRLDIIEPLGQLGFGKPGMDGAVADLMQAHRAHVCAALEPRRQMVAARFSLGRNRPAAQGADHRRAAGGGALGGCYGGFNTFA